VIKSSRTILASLIFAVVLITTVTPTYAVSLSDVENYLSGGIAMADEGAIVDALIKAILKKGHNRKGVLRLCEAVFQARPDLADRISYLIRRKMSRNEEAVEHAIGSDDDEIFDRLLVQIKKKGKQYQSTPSQQGPVTTQESTVRTA
jgi:hypothetical protein